MRYTRASLIFSTVGHATKSIFIHSRHQCNTCRYPPPNTINIKFSGCRISENMVSAVTNTGKAIKLLDNPFILWLVSQMKEMSLELAFAATITFSLLYADVILHNFQIRWRYLISTRGKDVKHIWCRKVVTGSLVYDLPQFPNVYIAWLWFAILPKPVPSLGHVMSGIPDLSVSRSVLYILPFQGSKRPMGFENPGFLQA